MKQETIQAIEQLLVEQDAVLTVPAEYNRAVFRRLVLSREIPILRKKLSEPQTFPQAFIEYYRDDIIDEKQNIAHELYWNIIILAFQPHTLQAMLAIISRRTKRYLQLLPSCHEHNSLDLLNTAPQPDDWKHYVFVDNIICDVRGVADLSFDAQVELLGSLLSHYPEVARAVYLHITQFLPTAQRQLLAKAVINNYTRANREDVPFEWAVTTSDIIALTEALLLYPEAQRIDVFKSVSMTKPLLIPDAESMRSFWQVFPPEQHADVVQHVDKNDIPFILLIADSKEAVSVFLEPWSSEGTRQAIWEKANILLVTPCPEVFRMTFMLFSAEKKLEKLIACYDYLTDMVAPYFLQNKIKFGGWGEKTSRFVFKNKLKVLLELFPVETFNFLRDTLLYQAVKTPMLLEDITDCLSEDQKVEIRKSFYQNQHKLLYAAIENSASLTLVITLYQPEQRLEVARLQDDIGFTLLHHSAFYIASLPVALAIYPIESRLEALLVRSNKGLTVWERTIHPGIGASALLTLLPADHVFSAVKLLTREGQPLLHQIVGHPETMRAWLTALSPDQLLEAVKLTDEYGRTILHKAATQDHETLQVIIDCLKKNHADQIIPLVEMADSKGRDVLYHAFDDCRCSRQLKIVIDLYPAEQQFAKIKDIKREGLPLLHYVAKYPWILAIVLNIYPPEQRAAAFAEKDRHGETVWLHASAEADSINLLLDNCPEEQWLDALLIPCFSDNRPLYKALSHESTCERIVKVVLIPTLMKHLPERYQWPFLKNVFVGKQRDSSIVTEVFCNSLAVAYVKIYTLVRNNVEENNHSRYDPPVLLLKYFNNKTLEEVERDLAWCLKEYRYDTPLKRQIRQVLDEMKTRSTIMQIIHKKSQEKAIPKLTAVIKNNPAVLNLVDENNNTILMGLILLNKVRLALCVLSLMQKRNIDNRQHTNNDGKNALQLALDQELPTVANGLVSLNNSFSLNLLGNSKNACKLGWIIFLWCQSISERSDFNTDRFKLFCAIFTSTLCEVRDTNKPESRHPTFQIMSVIFPNVKYNIKEFDLNVLKAFGENITTPLSLELIETVMDEFDVSGEKQNVSITSAQKVSFLLSALVYGDTVFLNYIAQLRCIDDESTLKSVFMAAPEQTPPDLNLPIPQPAQRQLSEIRTLFLNPARCLELFSELDQQLGAFYQSSNTELPEVNKQTHMLTGLLPWPVPQDWTGPETQGQLNKLLLAKERAFGINTHPLAPGFFAGSVDHQTRNRFVENLNIPRKYKKAASPLHGMEMHRLQWHLIMVAVERGIFTCITKKDVPLLLKFSTELIPGKAIFFWQYMFDASPVSRESISAVGVTSPDFLHSLIMFSNLRNLAACVFEKYTKSLQFYAQMNGFSSAIKECLLFDLARNQTPDTPLEEEQSPLNYYERKELEFYHETENGCVFFKRPKEKADENHSSKLALE